jgi:hypothetical protein
LPPSEVKKVASPTEWGSGGRERSCFVSVMRGMLEVIVLLDLLTKRERMDSKRESLDRDAWCWSFFVFFSLFPKRSDESAMCHHLVICHPLCTNSPHSTFIIHSPFNYPLTHLHL